MLVKFSTIAGGLFIEENGTGERLPDDRCFRFDAEGNSEYALFADVVENGKFARFFGHIFVARDFTFA